MHRIILLAALLPGCCSSPALAAVISRDWKTPGDGLLTYDDVNQREWLDLTESRLAMFPGATLEDRYSQLIVELVPPGRYAGFTVATPSDIGAFAAAAGITPSLDDFSMNDPATRDLIELVGISVSVPSRNVLTSYGLLDSIVVEGAAMLRTRGILLTIPESGPEGQAGLGLFGAFDSVRADNTGVWLYRQVPEPKNLAMSLLSLIWMHPRRGMSRSSRKHLV